LEAVTDDDGRVCQSAKRAFDDAFRTYDALDDTDAFDALIQQLGAVAAESDGELRRDVLDAKREAEFIRRTGYAHVLDDVAEHLTDEQ